MINFNFGIIFFSYFFYRPASKNPDEEENEVKDDFDWDGCDKIHKFMNDRYQAVLAETRPFALRNPWDKEEDEAEAEEEDDVRTNSFVAA